MCLWIYRPQWLDRTAHIWWSSSIECSVGPEIVDRTQWWDTSSHSNMPNRWWTSCAALRQSSKFRRFDSSAWRTNSVWQTAYMDFATEWFQRHYNLLSPMHLKFREHKSYYFELLFRTMSMYRNVLIEKWPQVLPSRKNTFISQCLLCDILFLAGSFVDFFALDRVELILNQYSLALTQNLHNNFLKRMKTRISIARMDGAGLK